MSLTTPAMSLPFDIFDCICQILGHRSTLDSESLRALSLTCKSMVALAQKHLFSYLYLSTDATAERLDAVLSSNPGIACYVRDLEYGIVAPIPHHIYNILELFKQSAALHFLYLWSRSYLRWNEIPSRMQELITALVQNPSITELKISRFKRFPSSILLGCTGITNFELLGEFTVTPNETPVSARNGRVKPKPLNLFVALGGWHAIVSFLRDGTIDFGSVQHANFSVFDPGQVPVAVGALRKMGDILTLRVNALRYHRPLTGLGEALMQHPQKKLKKLTFSHRLQLMNNENPNPLISLNSELKLIAGNNVIEELNLALSVFIDDGLRTDTDDLTTLDALLTTPGAFPELKRVSVETQELPPESAESREWRLSLVAWRDRFAKLSQSQSVKFTYSEKPSGWV